MIDLDDLQLSGTENVHLLENGFIQIFGIKIADTEAEHKQEVVGIQFPPEFAIQLLDWLQSHEEILMECCGADIPSDAGEDDRQMAEWNIEDDDDEDLDDDLYDDIQSDEFDDEDDSFEEDEDPYAPGFDPQE